MLYFKKHDMKIVNALGFSLSYVSQMLQIKPLTLGAYREKMAERFSCSKFTSVQLTQLINIHLMLGPKRSRNPAAVIWEVIATSCPHTLPAYQ